MAIKDIHLVKKYIWRDVDFVAAMTRILKYALSEGNDVVGLCGGNGVMLRDIVAGILQVN